MSALASLDDERAARVGVTLVLVVELMLIGALGFTGGLVRLRSLSWAPPARPSLPLALYLIVGIVVLASGVAAKIPPRLGAVVLVVPFGLAIFALVWVAQQGSARADDWIAVALVWTSVLTVLTLLALVRLWRGGVVWRGQVWLCAVGWLVALAVLHA